jgi:FkbH-like protein
MTKPGIKCVVWDLDNALWQGTLLEKDNLIVTRGVRIVLQELDDRGILQSIASKNDYEAAMETLEAFGLDHYFLYPQINWGNKSDSIKAIAEALGIGLNTLAFVDDEAFERDEVRYFLPDVAIIDSADIDKLLSMSRMRPRFITNESKMRRKMYQADISRDQANKLFLGTSQDFLKTLDMRLTIRCAGELDLERAEELTIRTNQLNSTGRPYSYEKLTSLLNSSDHTLLVAELEDRYGPSGTIGLALINERPRVWYLKLLTISCRVMTRGVGGIILSYVLQSAKCSKVLLRADFIPSDRNRIMYVTYKFNGFHEVGEEDGCIVLEHDLERITPLPDYVTVRSGEIRGGEGALQRAF